VNLPFDWVEQATLLEAPLNNFQLPCLFNYGKPGQSRLSPSWLNAIATALGFSRLLAPPSDISVLESTTAHPFLDNPTI
jgi:hypothetical protein